MLNTKGLKELGRGGSAIAYRLDENLVYKLLHEEYLDILQPYVLEEIRVYRTLAGCGNTPVLVGVERNSAGQITGLITERIFGVNPKEISDEMKQIGATLSAMVGKTLDYECLNNWVIQDGIPILVDLG